MRSLRREPGLATALAFYGIWTAAVLVEAVIVSN
jgi:hypothetical protein